MIATIQTHFETSADTAWETLKKKDTFLFITHGFLGFRGAKKWPDGMSASQGSDGNFGYQ